MEELFPVLIFLIIGVANAVSKAKKSEAAKLRHQAAAREKMPTPEKAEHPYSPAQPVPAQPITVPIITAADIPGPVVLPTVHPHVEPDCDTHDKPGSLGVTSLEGKDPCHEPQLTHTRSAIGESADTTEGLTFDWSGDSMVKTFVMQEILARPGARTPAGRKYAH